MPHFRSVALIVPPLEGDECGFTFASTLAVGGPRGQVLQQAHQQAHQVALSTNPGTSAGVAADMHALARTSAQALLSMKVRGAGLGVRQRPTAACGVAVQNGRRCCCGHWGCQRWLLRQISTETRTGAESVMRCTGDADRHHR
jgi:hypothetical protein